MAKFDSGDYDVLADRMIDLIELLNDWEEWDSSEEVVANMTRIECMAAQIRYAFMPEPE